MPRGVRGLGISANVRNCREVGRSNDSRTLSNLCCRTPTCLSWWASRERPEISKFWVGRKGHAHLLFSNGWIARQRLLLAGRHETEPFVEPLSAVVFIGDPQRDLGRAVRTSFRADRLDQFSRRPCPSHRRLDPHRDQVSSMRGVEHADRCNETYCAALKRCKVPVSRFDAALPFRVVEFQFPGERRAEGTGRIGERAQAYFLYDRPIVAARCAHGQALHRAMIGRWGSSGNSLPWFVLVDTADRASAGRADDAAWADPPASAAMTRVRRAEKADVCSAGDDNPGVACSQMDSDLLCAGQPSSSAAREAC
jgi:hypothetical protein